MFRHAKSTALLILGPPLICAAAGVGIPVASAKLAAAPQAQVAGSCGVGTGRGYGYSYLTSLSVRGTSCSTGRSLAKRHGRERGWSCRSTRLDSSPVQYDDRVSCKSGQRKVVWTYTQNK